MEIKYNVTGPDRKRLVQVIAQILKSDAKYLGVPSCAYQVDNFTISKDGILSFEGCAKGEQAVADRPTQKDVYCDQRRRQHYRDRACPSVRCLRSNYGHRSGLRRSPVEGGRTSMARTATAGGWAGGQRVRPAFWFAAHNRPVQ